MERQFTMKLALGLYRGSWGLGFPKKAGLPFWGVPRRRVMAFLALYWGSPIYGNYCVRWTGRVQLLGFRGLLGVGAEGLGIWALRVREICSGLRVLGCKILESFRVWGVKPGSMSCFSICVVGGGFTGDPTLEKHFCSILHIMLKLIINFKPSIPKLIVIVPLKQIEYGLFIYLYCKKIPIYPILYLLERD